MEKVPEMITELEIQHDIRDYIERCINSKLTQGYSIEEARKVDKYFVVSCVSAIHSKAFVVEVWNKMFPGDPILLYY